MPEMPQARYVFTLRNASTPQLTSTHGTTATSAKQNLTNAHTKHDLHELPSSRTPSLHRNSTAMCPTTSSANRVPPTKSSLQRPLNAAANDHDQSNIERANPDAAHPDQCPRLPSLLSLQFHQDQCHRRQEEDALWEERRPMETAT